jgi:hypothetical protein
METNALAPPAEATSAITLFGTTEPVLLIERATEVANALAGVVEKKQLYSTISGKRHVRVEGWTLLGSILGVFPVVVRTTELFRDEGKPFGFEAYVEARTRGGEVVGSAVARCTRDERRWKSADDYAILSMASTRATSKAMRLPLGWVMTLGGYEATPAEEMDGVFDRGEPPPPRRDRHDDDVRFDEPVVPGSRVGKAVTAADVVASVKSMMREDATLGVKTLGEARAKAGVTAPNAKAFTDADWIAVNPHLPAPWKVNL